MCLFHTAANVNSSAVVATASLLARTLYILASDKDFSSSALTAINVNVSLVEELLGCLLTCEPGLSCGLVKQFISPSTTCPGHYVGVILGEPTSSPYPGYVGDVSRFVWNFLANKTSIPSRNVSAACPKECSGSGEICIQVETDGKGVCVSSSTRYFMCITFSMYCNWVMIFMYFLYCYKIKMCCPLCNMLILSQFYA